jgi:hypothetical protein
MKRITLFLPLFLSLLSPALAGSIPKEEVSADAKWLIHLDAAQFRATKVGSSIITKWVGTSLPVFQGQLKEGLMLDLDAKKIIGGINSITIYGTDYQSPQDHAVLLVGTSPELQKILVGFLAGMVLAGTNAPMQVTQATEGSVTFYSIGQPGQAHSGHPPVTQSPDGSGSSGPSPQDAAYCAVLPDKVIAIGRSREATEHAAKVLAGKAPCLASGAAFGGFGDLKEAFFFVGAAEGFNLGANLPPQAKLLQVAEAVRVALGESANQVFLSLALRGKTSDVAAQMQQVVQGLIAVGSLSQPQDNDLGRLLQSIKVSSADNIVDVRVDYPVDKAIEQLTQASEKLLAHHGNLVFRYGEKKSQAAAREKNAAPQGQPPQADGKETPKAESDNGPAAPAGTK